MILIDSDLHLVLFPGYHSHLVPWIVLLVSVVLHLDLTPGFIPESTPVLPLACCILTALLVTTSGSVFDYDTASISATAADFPFKGTYMHIC